VVQICWIQFGNSRFIPHIKPFTRHTASDEQANTYSIVTKHPKGRRLKSLVEDNDTAVKQTIGSSFLV
jgi:hypothetical protein